MDPAEKSCDDDPGPSQAATQPSHRRTRSGCYTCRKRRVKCDELRPHCKRCQKGNRECVFPPERLTMSKKQRAIQERKLRRAAAAAAAAVAAAANANANANSTGSSGSAAAFAPTPGFGSNALLEVTTTNPDPLILPSSTTTIPASGLHQNTSTTASSISPPLPSSFISSSSSTDAPASFSSSSTSPASATKLSITPSAIPLNLVAPQPNSSQACTVSPEIARLFKYHAEHITPYHYFLSLDPFDFFPYIINAAPTCEPLMYALASFTSYHYALRHGERYLVDMFEYYEKCVHSLHDALAQPNILVMTAILTLSCIEMYLGDVSNEVQHQDVVFHLVETNYTPENFFVDQYHMYIFVWLRTIDVRRAMLSGHYLVFNTKWHNTHRTLLAQLSAICGTNEEVSMQLLIFKYIVDMGAIFSEVCKFGADVREEKLAGHSAVRRIEVLRVRSMTWIESFDRALFETDEIPENHGLSQEDLELIPPIIYKRREIGFIMVIYYAWKLYFSSYAALSTTGTIEDPQETTEIAVMIARIVNGFRALNRTHPGALFVLHNYLCMAALFLPPKLHVWVRRTLAHIQAMGYNFPEQVRWQMASVWKDDDLYKGWLEGLEPTDDPADGVVIPWKRLLQVKIPEMNQERMGFTTSMSEMRGIFGTGVDLGSAHIGA